MDPTIGPNPTYMHNSKLEFATSSFLLKPNVAVLVMPTSTPPILVDSLTVDDATVLLTYGEQTVNGPVTVDGIKATMISTTDVNGRNFNDFINSLIVNGTTDTFEGEECLGQM